MINYGLQKYKFYGKLEEIAENYLIKREIELDKALFPHSGLLPKMGFILKNRFKYCSAPQSIPELPLNDPFWY